MILADKIVALRKKSGWSQEELAQQLNVTRQSVSKWEGAQSVPDIDKILQMSRLFGVSTDYLLKDELEEPELAATAEEDAQALRRVTLAEASEYLRLRKEAAPKRAIATFLCVISPITLIMLAALSEVSSFGISENAAAGIGLCVLIVLVAVAVMLFMSCAAKERAYDFLESEPFETEYGVSGPAVFDLSRQAAAGGDGLTLQLDFLPGWSRQEVMAWLERQRQVLSRQEAGALLTGGVHPRLGRMLCKAAGISGGQPVSELTDRQLGALCRQVREFTLPVTGTCGFDQAQVTAGGLRTGEFDPRTMESRLVPGFYACGEVLDIDGDCGGFNLQWAWASGRLAGRLLHI